MRAAVALAAKARASLQQRDRPIQEAAPGARQAAPSVQAPDDARPTARERPSRPHVRAEAPEARWVLPLSHALRAAAALAARAWPSGARKDAAAPEGASLALLGDLLPRSEAHSWTKARIAVAQNVWGEGALGPGGKDMVLDMVEPLGLKRNMSVLDLGAGLGGPARIMAKRFGVRVTGMEWEPGLVKAGKALSKRRFWSSRKVSIHYPGWGEGRISLESFDRFVAKDCLFAIPDKEGLLRAIADVLTDHGELLFTDFVLTAPERRTPAVEAWIAAEPETPAPWSAMDYIQLLTGLGLNLRIDDRTGPVCSAIRESWTAMDARLEKTKLGPARLEVLESEAALWARRVRLLESGELNYYRFHVARRL